MLRTPHPHLGRWARSQLGPDFPSTIPVAIILQSQRNFVKTTSMSLLFSYLQITKLAKKQSVNTGREHRIHSSNSTGVGPGPLCSEGDVVQQNGSYFWEQACPTRNYIHLSTKARIASNCRKAKEQKLLGCSSEFDSSPSVTGQAARPAPRREGRRVGFGTRICVTK